MTDRLSLDLLATDLDDRADLTGLLARHVIGPARTLFGMVMPSPDERPDTFLATGRVSFGLGSFAPIWHQDPSVSVIEPILRGALLAGALFPGANRLVDLGEGFVAAPGNGLINRAMALALLRWDELEWLVGRLSGQSRPPPVDSGSLRPLAGALVSNGTLVELRGLQTLVRRALLPPDEEIDADMPYARVETGLESIDATVAGEIDAILRADVRMRLVRLVDIEPAFGLEAPIHPDAPDAVTPVLVDRGVFPMLLPESLAGLVVLDLVETLRLDRKTAICALCKRPFVPASQQASLARRGEPVYHPECMPEHRRRYMRDYRAGRVGTDHRRSAVSQ
jgi:hypothetical protein